MVTTCFFCQNLLSDYLEGLLPSARQDELRQHIETCKDCTEVQKDLQSTLGVLKTIPSYPLSHDLALRITEASQAASARLFSRVSISRTILFLAVPLLLVGAATLAFPTLFPWFSRFRTEGDAGQFARYYPLLQGASDIVEEQANYLHVREPFMRSLWEEGGLSPEEFEKAFQVKAFKNSEN